MWRLCLPPPFSVPAHLKKQPHRHCCSALNLHRDFRILDVGMAVVWKEELQRQSSDMGQEIRPAADFSPAGKHCYFASWQKKFLYFPFPGNPAFCLPAGAAHAKPAALDHTEISWSLQRMWSSLMEREKSSEHSQRWDPLGCHRNPRAF